jgi:hypothetical protein
MKKTLTKITGYGILCNITPTVVTMLSWMSPNSVHKPYFNLPLFLDVWVFEIAVITVIVTVGLMLYFGVKLITNK